MTYLQLINNVLTRLREDVITADQIDSDPYFRFIGTAINDAKDRVEDAWQWGALRGTDHVILDSTNLSNNGTTYFAGNTVALPNSSDSHYIIKRIFAYPVVVSQFEPTVYVQDLTQTENFLRWTNIDRMRQLYQTPAKAGSGRPDQFAVTGETNRQIIFPDDLNGTIQLTLWPYPTTDATDPDIPLWGLGIDRVNHQPTLVSGTDRLKVPSLPVYTLATALASRERGEVGGTPTSELFAIADRHLGDAIAQDSALYANELDWYANDQEHNTNVRFA
jgi:hypothetical protein